MDRLQQRLEDMRWEKGCTWFWPKEGWQEEEAQDLPELETDLVLIERWKRLRQMVNSKDPGPTSPELPSEPREQEQEQDQEQWEGQREDQEEQGRATDFA
jgi:hypothetical protein